MKYRFLFPLLLLSLFLLPFSSSYTTASKKRSSDEKKIKNWIEQRINSQLEGRVDPRGFRFPEQQQEQSTEVDTKRFSYKQAKDPFVDFLINGTLTNTRANDPRFETGARVQNGTSSAVSGQDIVVAYNDIGTEFSAVSYSNDGGRTWSQTFIPQFAEGKNFGSGVVAAGTGLFYYAGLAQNRSGATVIIISRSTDGGRNWSVPIQVFPQNVLGVIQDKPWIAVDNTNSPNAGNVYVGWTEIRASGSRIDFAASTDGGKTFPNGIALTPFDPRFNLQGINIAVGAEGEVYAAWGDLNVRGIRFARSVNAGQSFALIDTAVSVTTYELIGPLLNSHFSVNGLPSIAVDKSQTSSRGNIYITFNSPVPGKNADKADVFFIRSTDRGASWSSPLRVNNDIGNTDQFMPSVAVATDGTVGVMWYDRSNDPKFNALLDVFAAISKDGGKSFLPSRRITTANWLVLPTPITIRNNYHGDYNQMSALTDRAGFLFAWGDDRSGLDPDVYTAVLETSDLEQPIAGLTISPVIPSQTVIAGQGTILRVKLKRVGGLASGVNDSVTFSATSDTDSISFDFDRNNISSGDEVALFAKTSATTSSGTHPVVVKATVNGFTTTSTLRLNVVAQSQFARLPFNVSRSAGRSIQPNLFVDQTNNLHAVWGDNTEANFRIVYSKSKDSSSFTLPVTVSQNTNRTALNSQVNVDKNGNIHVVWQECMGSDCKVMYSRSVDQGSSFSVPQNLSPTLDFSELPTIATTDSEVVVFWNGVQSLISLGFEIFNARSTDGGATFSPTGVVASGGAGNLYNAAVSNDGNGKTYLAYENCLSGGCQIEVLRSTGNLSSFSKVGTASQGINFAFKPSISAIATGEVYVSMSGALSDGDSRFEIFTSVSRDNGNSFTRVQNVSNTPEFSSESTILATENSVYLAWVDRSTGNSEILLSRSNDKGASFIPAVNLTGNITISQAPTLATSASKDVFLIFEDEVDGNDDIYFSLIDGVDRPAKIVQLDPDNGPVGTSFRIVGSDVATARSVQVAGTSSNFFLSSSSELVAVVPAGARTGNVSIETTAGRTESSFPFNVTGAISVGPSIVDFGRVVGGQVGEPKTVAIRNLGSRPLKINSLTPSTSDFQLASSLMLPLTIAPSESIEVAVRFQPSSTGKVDGSLRVVSDDPILPNLNIALTGQVGDFALRLVAPQQGLKLRAGDSFVIQWQAESSDITEFELRLSSDSGRTFATQIASGLTSSTRSFIWTVPSVKTKTARVAIIAKTQSGTVFVDQSRGDFRIKTKK